MSLWNPLACAVDAASTLDSWPKRIYEWEQLPEEYRQPLKSWREAGMPSENVTYVPPNKLHRGYAAAWFDKQVALLKKTDTGGIYPIFLRHQDVQAVSYEQKLLICEVTLYLSVRGKAKTERFSYNRMTDSYFLPILNLLMGQEADYELEILSHAPHQPEWLMQKSFAMYNYSKFAYRMDETIEYYCYGRVPYQKPLMPILHRGENTHDFEYVFAISAHGMSLIYNYYPDDGALYLYWPSIAGFHVERGKKNFLIASTTSGHQLRFPIQAGDDPELRELLVRAGCFLGGQREIAL